MNGDIPEQIPVDGDILARLEEIEGAAAWMQAHKEVDYKTVHDMIDSLAQILARFLYTK